MMIIDSTVDLTDDDGVIDCALLSETALAVDWNRPEEDAAWQYLQDARR